jgi:hypothetical protein
MNADSDLCMAIDESSVVYRKSGSGAAQLVSVHGSSLSARERQVLILLDGRRTIEELSEFFGAEAIWRLISSLEAKGFAKRVDPELPPEWSNSLTRIQGAWLTDESLAQKTSSSMAASRWHHDWFALVNLGMLVFVIAMVTGLWAIDRHHTTTVMPFGARHGQPFNPQEVAAPSDEHDATEPDRVAATITPMKHLSAISGARGGVPAGSSGDTSAGTTPSRDSGPQ